MARGAIGTAMTVQHISTKHRRKSPQRGGDSGTVDNIDVTARRCPVCHATAGKPCHDKTSKKRHPHAARATNTADPGPLPKKNTKKPSQSRRASTSKQQKTPVDPELKELQARQTRLAKYRTGRQRAGRPITGETADEYQLRLDYAAWRRRTSPSPEA